MRWRAWQRRVTIGCVGNRLDPQRIDQQGCVGVIAEARAMAAGEIRTHRCDPSQWHLDRTVAGGGADVRMGLDAEGRGVQPLCDQSRACLVAQRPCHGLDRGELVVLQRQRHRRLAHVAAIGQPHAEGG